jgi:2-oxoacid:acceptor oxidoreductase delta subunit (pyruvate/2-ketoisovalerate family)
VGNEYIRGAGIHASGTIAMVNKTGTWRLLDPVVDDMKCIGCKICSDFCPDDCIERLVVEKDAPPGTKRIIIDLEYCKGCGICAHECPKDAITMVKIEA